MNAIHWPARFTPGTTDNFVANEVILAGLRVDDLWLLLSRPATWPAYYAHATDIHFPEGAGPEVRQGTRFHFTTFGFPVAAKVTECVPPVAGQPARLAWHARLPDEADSAGELHRVY